MWTASPTASSVYVAGVMEHIEEAGIHSGDSACALPPYSLSPAMVAELRAQTEALARGLGVVGLMNVQFAIKDDEVFVLEVNPRASRTVPFVAKATGVAVAKIGARVMAGGEIVGVRPGRSTPRPRMSRSRKRCSRSTASRMWTPSLARR